MSASDLELSRAQWGSRFGFLMAMLGAMIGAGNIWRFPYVTGEEGGGAFILAYLVLLLLLAIPGLIAEVALGRFTERGVIGAFRKVGTSRGVVGLGVVVLLVNVVLMSYYSPVVGWTLYYAVHSLLLTFTSAGFEPTSFWEAFQASTALNVGMHSVVMGLVAGVLYLGIRRGIERLVIYAVPGLILALVAITLRALTLPGATQGLIFTFDIEWAALTRSSTWITALGQSLFSTGLGWGIALTVGSYLPAYDDIPIGGGVFTVLGQSSIGILAAFAIFPIVFAFGIDPAEPLHPGGQPSARRTATTTSSATATASATAPSVGSENSPGSATGASSAATVTVSVAVSVSPASFVTVSVTSYSPGSANDASVVLPAAASPSIDQS